MWHDAAMSPTHRPVLLVHGAWHGAWCFAHLQAELDRRGVPSFAVDLPGHGASTAPLGDLYGDAALVAEALTALRQRYGSDVVLAGHSYGGAVVTQAAGDGAGIAHLVYLTAFALDAGESVASFLGAQPAREVALARGVRQRDDGTSVVDPTVAPEAFYADCPAEIVAPALARLTPQLTVTFTQPVTVSPRVAVPSTFLLCTRDEAIHPDHQRTLAARCDAVTELAIDHSPFASAVAATADLLERAARG